MGCKGEVRTLNSSCAVTLATVTVESTELGSEFHKEETLFILTCSNDVAKYSAGEHRAD